MSLTIQTQTLDIIGIIYSSLGLLLSVAQCSLLNLHSRSLDYIQWCYILSVAYLSTVTAPFSSQLEIGSSNIALSTNVLANFYCTKGLYVCGSAFAISFAVVLVGVLMLIRLITIPEKVASKGFTFARVYRVLKGLIRWFYLPLVYQSLYYLINGISSQLIPSVVILAVLLIFPIVQFFLYRKFTFSQPQQPASQQLPQKQKKSQQKPEQTQAPQPRPLNPHTNPLQLASYLKSCLFALLVVISVKYSSTAYHHYIDLIIVAYAASVLIFMDFRYDVVGRVLYVVGEIVFYFLFSLFSSGSNWFNTYYIQLFGLGIIIGLDLVYTIMQFIPAFKQWKANLPSTSAAEIVPEQSKDAKEGKKQKYKINDQILDLSRDQFTDSKVTDTQLYKGDKVKSKKKLKALK